MTSDSQIVPLEVKAGSTGRLRSLQTFLEMKNLLRILEFFSSLFPTKIRY